MRSSTMTDLLKGRRGAFDMPSIVAAVIVVAFLTAGVLATVFGIIPFSQDNGSKQDVMSVRTAESVARTKDGRFMDTAGLIAAGYLPESSVSYAGPESAADEYFARVESTTFTKVVAGTNAAGDCYLALGKSRTGSIFYGTDIVAEPKPLIPSDDPGCLTAEERLALVAELGGFDSIYAPEAPVANGSLYGSSVARFSWAATENTTGYRVESRINAGDWSTVQENQTETTASVTGEAGDTVELRVASRNASGDSAFSTASVQLPASVVANWGFESGLSSWTKSGTVTASSNARTGVGSANLSADGSTSSLSQAIPVPAESSTTLSLWYKNTNATNNYSATQVRFLSSTGTVLATPFTNYGTAAAWTRITADMTAYKGQTITLQLIQTSSLSSYAGNSTFDDVTLTSTPPVPSAAPTRLGASGEDGGASLAWVAPASPATNITSYTITPYLDGTAQAPKTVFGNPAPANTTVTGLTNGVSYTFTVTATNSAGTSPESAPSLPVTPGPVVIRNAGFEVGLKDWSASGSATTSTNTRTGVGSAFLSSVTGTASLSQAFTVPAESFSTLSFWYKNSNIVYSGYVRSEVRILSATGSVLATAFSSQGSTSEWTMASADLTDFRGQTVSVQFIQTSQGSYYTGTFTIDDLSVTSTPPVTTAAPTGVGATAENAGASLAWTAPSSRATAITAYTITPYLNGAAQATKTVAGTAPSATVTGLTNGASYTFTVSATNSAGTSPESAPSEAVTPGPVVIKNAGFEAGLKDWSASRAVTSTNTRSGVGSAFLSSATGTASLSQAFTLPAESFTTLSFWYKNSNQAYNGAVRSEARILSATGSVLATAFSSQGNTSEWTMASADLTDFRGQTVSVQFIQTTQASLIGTFTIDDITLTSTPPVPTAAPTRVGVSGEDAGASLVWTAPPSRATAITSYTITPYLNGAAQAATTVAGTATSTTVTGLTNGSEYTFTVRATNSAGTSPESAMSLAVTPGPTLVRNGGFEAGLKNWNTNGSLSSATVRTGINAAYLTGSASYPGYALQTVQIPNDMHSTLVFWYTGGGSAYASTQLQVLSAAGTLLSTPFTVSSSNNAWTQASADLTNYRGQSIQLKFHQIASSGYSGYTYLDDITLTTTPPVPTAAPTRVGVTAEDAAASLTWAAPASPATAITGYTITPYIDGVAQTAKTIAGTSTSATVTGLSNQAAYTFTVAATNSAGTSAESDPSAAITPGPAMIKNAGFEAGLKDWTSTGSFTASTTTHGGFGAASVATTSDRFLSQSITVPAESFTSLSFWYLTNNNGTSTEVQILSPAGTLLATPFINTGNTNAWTQATVDLTDFKGQTITLRLAQRSNGNYSGSSFDDLVITNTPPVITAAPARVGAAGEDGAVSLSWTAPSSRATAITAYTITPHVDGVAQEPVVITGNPAPNNARISGLANGTAYAFTVTATNSAGTSPASAPSEAVTPGPVTIKNAGFEAGLKDWASFGSASTSTVAYSGVNSAYLYGTTSSYITQTVALPSDQSTSLSFWFQNDNSINTNTELQLLSPAGALLATPFVSSADNPSWTPATVNLSTYHGQSIQLRFFQRTTGNSSNAKIDALTLTSSEPTAPGTPTLVNAVGTGNTSVNVTWTAPPSGGATITSYTVTPYLGVTAQTPVTVTGDPAQASAAVTGLTSGQSYTFRVSATNALGTSEDSAPSPAITQNALANGSFEAGLASWSTSGSPAVSVSGSPYSGSKAVLLGNANYANQSLYQAFTVPNTANPTLTYWVRASSGESSGQYDIMTVQLLNASGAALTSGTTGIMSGTWSSWIKHTIPLTAYKGQTVRIHFNFKTDGSILSSVNLDDIRVND